MRRGDGVKETPALAAKRPRAEICEGFFAPEELELADCKVLAFFWIRIRSVTDEGLRRRKHAITKDDSDTETGLAQRVLDTIR
jgi:hypothetical protein